MERLPVDGKCKILRWHFDEIAAVIRVVVRVCIPKIAQIQQYSVPLFICIFYVAYIFYFYVRA